MGDLTKVLEAKDKRIEEAVSFLSERGYKEFKTFRENTRGFQKLRYGPHYMEHGETGKVGLEVYLYDFSDLFGMRVPGMLEAVPSFEIESSFETASGIWYSSNFYGLSLVELKTDLERLEATHEQVFTLLGGKYR